MKPKASNDREWVGGKGGPLILIPEALLSEWTGIDVPSYRVVEAKFRWSDKEPRASDYDRACDVDDYVGVIAVGFGEGLVLGDLPQATTWIPQDFGGVFARWEYAEDDNAMDAALTAFPNSLAWEPKATFVVVGSPLELFNSAEPGMEPIFPRLMIDLEPGTYDVSWTRYAPNDSTAATLVSLRRSAA